MGEYLYYTTGVRHSSVDAGQPEDRAERRNSSPAAAPRATAGQFQRAWPAVRSTHTSRLHKLIRDASQITEPDS